MFKTRHGPKRSSVEKENKNNFSQLTGASTLYLAIHTSSFVRVATYSALLSCWQVVNFGSAPHQHRLPTAICTHERLRPDNPPEHRPTPPQQTSTQGTMALYMLSQINENGNSLRVNLGNVPCRYGRYLYFPNQFNLLNSQRYSSLCIRHSLYCRAELFARLLWMGIRQLSAAF